MAESTKKLPIDITHFGEALLTEVFNQKKEETKTFLGLESTNFIAKANVKIKDNKCSFDGKHEIDVAICYEMDDRKICLPVELKLGRTRMKALPKELLRFFKGYKVSKHRDDCIRIAGSMMSILSRKKANADSPSLNVKTECGYEVSKRWILIVRTDAILNELKTELARNKMEERIRNNTINEEATLPIILSMESSIKKIGENNFNTTVKDLLACDDYYKEWF